MDLILFEVMMWGRPSQSWPVLKLSQPWKTSKESTSRRVRSEEALPCCQLYPIVSNEKRQSDTTCFFPTWQKFAGGRPRVSGGLHFDRSAQVRQRWFNKSSRFQLSNMRRNKTDPTIFESQLYLESFWKNVQRSDDYATYFHGLYSRIQKEVPFWAGKLWLLWLCRRSLTWERGTTAKHHDSKNRSGVGDADAAAAILEAAARPIPPKKSRLQTFSSVICVLCSSNTNKIHWRMYFDESIESVLKDVMMRCFLLCDVLSHLQASCPSLDFCLLSYLVWPFPCKSGDQLMQTMQTIFFVQAASHHYFIQPFERLKKNRTRVSRFLPLWLITLITKITLIMINLPLTLFPRVPAVVFCATSTQV